MTRFDQDDGTRSELRELFRRIETLSPDSDFADLFATAQELTSQRDALLNQRIKFLRFAGMYHCLNGVLRRGVQGDVAECGCFRGQSSWIISSMLQRSGFAARFAIFDSFQGLSEFGTEDLAGTPAGSASIEERRRRFASPEGAVRELLSAFSFVDIYAGWIPDRFPELADRRFAFVHVDVDLFRPTRDALEFFYPRLVPEGTIVVDDYSWRNFPGARAAVDGFVSEHSPRFFLPLQAGGCVIVR